MKEDGTYDEDLRASGSRRIRREHPQPGTGGSAASGTEPVKVTAPFAPWAEKGALRRPSLSPRQTGEIDETSSSTSTSTSGMIRDNFGKVLAGFWLTVQLAVISAVLA